MRVAIQPANVPRSAPGIANMLPPIMPTASRPSANPANKPTDPPTIKPTVVRSIPHPHIPRVWRGGPAGTSGPRAGRFVRRWLSHPAARGGDDADGPTIPERADPRARDPGELAAAR